MAEDGLLPRRLFRGPSVSLFLLALLFGLEFSLAFGFSSFLRFPAGFSFLPGVLLRLRLCFSLLLFLLLLFSFRGLLLGRLFFCLLCRLGLCK